MSVQKALGMSGLFIFLMVLQVQSEDVLSRAERINELLNQWKIDVASSGSHVPAEMVQHLAVNPYFSTRKIAEDLAIAYITAPKRRSKT